MTKISACIISYNEADRIAHCIGSLAFCDEIIVIDSGSGDGTVTIAESLGARVIYRKFDGFRSQKQFAVEQARNDWILALDADESVSEALRTEIMAEQSSGFIRGSGYRFPRCDFYHGRFLRHGNFYRHYVLRLFDRRFAGWHGDREIHERVLNTGDTCKLRGDLLHYPYRNFGHELDKLRSYARMMAEHRRANGTKASYLKLFTSPIALFLRGFLLRLGFLDGFPGLIRHINNAVYAFHKELYLFDDKPPKI
jgi:glycosyltransferase involved in cell wall biosynthesis